MNKQIRMTVSFVMMVLAMFFTVNNVSAQQRGHQEPPPIPDNDEIETMVTKLSSQLSLTEGQEKQISALYFTHFDAVKEMIQKNRGKRNRTPQAMKTMRENFETEVKSLLNKEQQKEFDAFQKKNTKGKGRGKRPRH